MEYNKEQVKDIVANIDADVYIARNETKTVAEFVKDMGYNISMKKIEAAVKELQKDPYFKMLAGRIG